MDIISQNKLNLLSFLGALGKKRHVVTGYGGMHLQNISDSLNGNCESPFKFSIFVITAMVGDLFLLLHLQYTICTKCSFKFL